MKKNKGFTLSPRAFSTPGCFLLPNGNSSRLRQGGFTLSPRGFSLRQGGFTLIELLVVIAIIGILAAVVLANLQVAQQKAIDARIKDNLNSFITQAQYFYSDHEASYGVPHNVSPYSVEGCNEEADITAGSLFADPNILEMLKNTWDASGNQAGALCASDGESFVVSIPLKSENNKYWCIDSKGSGGVVTSELSGVSCPSS